MSLSGSRIFPVWMREERGKFKVKKKDGNIIVSTLGLVSKDAENSILAVTPKEGQFQTRYKIEDHREII